MENRVELKKTLKPHMIMAVALGSSIGWGCFVMPGDWLRSAGLGGVLIGYAIGAALMMMIAVGYGFMIRKFPVSGGGFAYAYIGFERNHAFFCGWFLTLGYMSIVALNASACALLVKFLAPNLMAKTGLMYQIAGWDVYFGEVIIASIALIIFAYFNIRGAEMSGNMQFWMCMGFLAGALLLAAGCIMHPAAGPANVTQFFPTGMKPLSAIIAIVAIAPWAYVGFDNVPQAAEEFDFPPSKAFALLVLALALAYLMYALLVIATAFSTPWEAIEAQRSAWATGESISRYFGPIGLTILAFSMLMGVATGLNGFYLSVSRLLFAMGRAKVVPEWFAEIHPKYGTPKNGIIFTCLVCMLAPWFGREVLGWIVDMASVGVTVAYFYTSAVAFKYTKWSGDPNDGTVDPVVKFFSLCGTLASLTFLGLLLIPGLSSSLGTQSWIALGVWVALGLIFYILRNKDFKQITKERMNYLILGDSVENLNTNVDDTPSTGSGVSKKG